MNKRPKIWTSEDQILASIDRTKRAADRSLKRSIALNEKAKAKFGRCEELRFELMKSMTEDQRTALGGKLYGAELSAGAAKEAADNAAKAYHRAVNSTLPRLGEILAALRTQPMVEVLGSYRGVAVK